ncbi:MAG: hypothetical protein ACK4KT_08090 [Thermaurantimonas sp.]
MLDFSTDISLIWWVLATGILGWAVFRLYRAQVDVFGRKVTSILRLLRAAALSLMLFLLIRPVFLIQKIEEKPKSLIWMIDHSASMVLSSDSDRVKKLPDQIHLINTRLHPHLMSEVLSFGSKVSEQADFEFRQPATDGYQWIQHLIKTRSAGEIAAVVLVSDGIFNTSYSPEFFVNELKVPVYTIGTGDTTVLADASVVSVVYPKKVLPDSEFEVEILTRAVHLENVPLKISLKGEGVLHGSFTFTPGSSPDSRALKATLQAQKPGVHRYTVVIDTLPGEKNTQNNLYTFYIEVIDQKGKILLIDEIKHPDLRVVRQYFAKFSPNELVTVGPDSLRFLNDVYDLAIVHSPAHPETFTYLKKNPRLPLLAILGYGANPGALSELIGREVVRFGREDRAFPILNEQFYKISGETFLYSANLPPLDVFYSINGISNSDILSFQKIGGTSTTRPLISLLESTRKTVLFHGEGIWRWANFLRMNDDSTSMDGLFLKLTRWLTQTGKKDPFEVILPEKVNSEDRFVVKAYLYDESDLPVTNAGVVITFTDSSGRTFEYRLPYEGSLYTNIVQGLRPGTYRWNANASLAGASWSSSGILIVEENMVEYYDLVANHQVLRQIAENTGAAFYTLDQLDQLEKELLSRKFLPQLVDRSKKIKLIDWWPYFFLIFIFIGLEWFLRRYLGSY